MYVVSEAKMTNIFAVYLQGSGFQCQSSEYMLSSADLNSLGDMVSPCRTPPQMLILLLSLCRWTVIDGWFSSSVVSSLFVSTFVSTL